MNNEKESRIYIIFFVWTIPQAKQIADEKNFPLITTYK